MALDMLFADPASVAPSVSPPSPSALSPIVLQDLRASLERLHEYVIRLRCEDPAKGTRSGAFAYLQAQTDKLAARSAEAGGTERGWPDPGDVLADGDQIDGLRNAVGEVIRLDAPYPVPLPPGCWLLPTANFDVFAAGRLYNGKVAPASVCGSEMGYGREASV